MLLIQSNICCKHVVKTLHPPRSLLIYNWSCHEHVLTVRYFCACCASHAIIMFLIKQEPVVSVLEGANKADHLHSWERCLAIYKDWYTTNRPRQVVWRLSLVKKEEPFRKSPFWWIHSNFCEPSHLKSCRLCNICCIQKKLWCGEAAIIIYLMASLIPPILLQRKSVYLSIFFRSPTFSPTRPPFPPLCLFRLLFRSVLVSYYSATPPILKK